MIDSINMSDEVLKRERIEIIIELLFIIKFYLIERDLSIILHGGTYNNEPQQANITFICVKDVSNNYNYKETDLYEMYL